MRCYSLEDTALVVRNVRQVDDVTHTLALVLAHQIATRRSVLTRVARALVDVLGALWSRETQRTGARVAVDAVHTHFVRLAVRRNAVVDVDAAVGAREAVETGAREVT